MALLPEELALQAKGWTKNRRGAWEPGPDTRLDGAYDQLLAQMDASNPGWRDEIYGNYATNYAIDPEAHDYRLGYAVARQQLGMEHEDAARVARMLIGKTPEQVLARGVQPEDINARKFALLPLSSQIPVPQAVAQQKPATQKGVRATNEADANERERLLGLMALVANEYEVPMAEVPVENVPPSRPVVITPSAAPEPARQVPVTPVEAAVEEMKQQEPLWGPQGRRMAMKYGAPTLGALLGLYGLAAITGNNNAQSEQEVASV